MGDSPRVPRPEGVEVIEDAMARLFARAAVGMASLPLGIAVEIDMVVEVAD